MFKNSTRSQTIWLSRHTSYPIKHPHPLLSWPEASRCFTNCKNKTDITTRRVLWSNSFPLHSKSSPFLLLQQQQGVCSLCERWAWLWHTVCGTVGGQCCVIPPADLVEAHRYILPDSSLFFNTLMLTDHGHWDWDFHPTPNFTAQSLFLQSVWFLFLLLCWNHKTVEELHFWRGGTRCCLY